MLWDDWENERQSGRTDAFNHHLSNMVETVCGDTVPSIAAIGTVSLMSTDDDAYLNYTYSPC